MMNLGGKFIALALLLLAATASAYASPFTRGFGNRSAMRPARPQRALQPEERMAPQQQSPADSRRIPGTLSTPSGFGEPGAVGNAARAQDPQSRRVGARMTVEERRALRRQINEAGHDIYAPKR